MNFECFISVHIVVLYEDAVKYMKRRRNNKPAFYNEARLAEKPIPATQQVEEEVVDVNVNVSVDEDVDSNHLVADLSPSQDDIASAVDPFSGDPENANKEMDQIEPKPNIEQLTLRVANNNDILHLIDDDDDVGIISYEGEQFEMIVGSKGFAKPMILMSDNRVKRENDEISGSEPYYESVSKITSKSR